MKSTIYQLLLLLIFVGCNRDMNTEQKMIEYVLSDSTLYLDFIFEGSKTDYDEIRKGSYRYSVHSLINSSMIDYQRSSCFSKMDSNGDMIKVLENRLNKTDNDLVKLSYSDSAIVHFFFTERIDDLKGVAAFYLDWTKFPKEDVYSDPLSFIWDMNRGRFYLYEFKKGTDEIMEVCKETIINE